MNPVLVASRTSEGNPLDWGLRNRIRSILPNALSISSS